jgi:hypothetical protein
VNSERFFCLPSSNQDFIFEFIFHNLPSSRTNKINWEKDIQNLESICIKAFDLDGKGYSQQNLLPGDVFRTTLHNAQESYDGSIVKSGACQIIALETNNISFPEGTLTIHKRGFQSTKGLILFESFPGKPFPIEGNLITLAHKLICREDLSCDIFACCPSNLIDTLTFDSNSVIYNWNILDCSGKIIAKGHTKSKPGNYIHINVNSLIEAHYFNQLLTLKMTSTYKNQTIFTVLHNDKTIAIEHSLPPGYYLGEKAILDESRKYAFGFN